MAHDGLGDVFTDQAMGALDRQLQCRNAAGHPGGSGRLRCSIAPAGDGGRRAGVMAEEIVEVRVPQRRGDDLVVTADEGIREGVTAESLARLPPAFGKHGSITAGSSSPISDGAAAVVVASQEAAERLGLTPLAEIGAHAMVAGPDSSLQLQPSNAIALACKKQQIAVDGPGPDRDQRGLRRGRGGECSGAGAERAGDRRPGQRQRRCHRARTSDRCLRRAAGAHPCD